VEAPDILIVVRVLKVRLFRVERVEERKSEEKLGEVSYLL
jgi:hypothetical protein